MRKIILPVAIAGSLALGGCASLGGVLDPLLGGDGRYDDRNLSSFEREAYQSCSNEAARYGRAYVEDVRQIDRDHVRVSGRFDTRDTRSDDFACVYRSDRRIVEFRIS